MKSLNKFVLGVGCTASVNGSLTFAESKEEKILKMKRIVIIGDGYDSLITAYILGK